jgi:hypothetical protein
VNKRPHSVDCIDAAVNKAVAEGCGDEKHAGWTVVRDGFYGREPHRRQRYRCFDPHNRAEWHRFTPKVVRLEAVEPRCLECESPLDFGEGPNSARRCDFPAREIAAALVAVANGSTYSHAALTARQSVFQVSKHFGVAHRAVEKRAQPGQSGNENSRHGTLVASWVETFTDVVLGADPVPMPLVLLLDSTSFWRRQGGRRTHAFSVLTAYGYDTWPGSGWLLRAAAYRRANAQNWEAFLSEMPGMPQVVVSDRAKEIRNAVDARWPTPGVGNRPEKVFCRWHLARNLREALMQDIRLADARQHPLYERAERAFDDITEWKTYVKVTTASERRFDLAKQQLPASLTWLTENDLLVRAQMARRPDRIGPESVGPLEADVRFLRERLRGRAQSLRNQPRTNQLLRLMVAARQGAADERVWAERIRVWLLDHEGQLPRQRPLTGAGGL